MEKILIRQKRSVIGCEKRILKIMRSMGFRNKSHVGSKVVQIDNEPMRGKINLVSHIVEVENI